MTHRQPDLQARSRATRPSCGDDDQTRWTCWRSLRSRRVALLVRTFPWRANCGRGVPRREFYQDAQKADSTATWLRNGVQGHPAVSSPCFRPLSPRTKRFDVASSIADLFRFLPTATRDNEVAPAQPTFQQIAKEVGASQSARQQPLSARDLMCAVDHAKSVLHLIPQVFR